MESNLNKIRAICVMNIKYEVNYFGFDGNLSSSLFLFIYMLLQMASKIYPIFNNFIRKTRGRPNKYTSDLIELNVTQNQLISYKKKRIKLFYFELWFDIFIICITKETKEKMKFSYVISHSYYSGGNLI